MKEEIPTKHVEGQVLGELILKENLKERFLKGQPLKGILTFSVCLLR